MARNQDLPLRTKFVFNLIGVVVTFAVTQYVGFSVEWYWWLILAFADVFTLFGALLFYGFVEVLLGLSRVEDAIRA